MSEKNEGAAAPAKNIYQRINAVMLEVDSARKDGYNKHHGYKFVSHDDVTAAIRNSMAKHGIVQRVSTTGVRRNGIDLSVDVCVEWINIEDPSDRHSVESYGESFGMKRSDEQQIGKAVSYAVKLAQLKNFALIGDDTPDTEEEHGADEPKTKQVGTWGSKTTVPDYGDDKFPPEEKPNQKPIEPGNSAEGSPNLADEFIREFSVAANEEAFGILRKSVKKFWPNFSDDDKKKVSSADKAAFERIMKLGQ